MAPAGPPPTMAISCMLGASRQRKNRRKEPSRQYSTKHCSGRGGACSPAHSIATQALEDRGSCEIGDDDQDQDLAACEGVVSEKASKPKNEAKQQEESETHGAASALRDFGR